jgi:trimethylamine:corrinoid methyltransferase-like protein
LTQHIGSVIDELPQPALDSTEGAALQLLSDLGIEVRMSSAFECAEKAR